MWRLTIFAAIARAFAHQVGKGFFVHTDQDARLGFLLCSAEAYTRNNGRDWVEVSFRRDLVISKQAHFANTRETLQSYAKNVMGKNRVGRD